MPYLHLLEQDDSQFFSAPASMKKKEGVSLASCELLPSATPQSAIASLKASLSLRGMLELGESGSCSENTECMVHYVIR